MPAPFTPFDPIGPLQLRIMNYIWKVQVVTVQEVMMAVNGQPGTTPMAYTTFLTVMRNLAKRRILDQRQTATKRHQFVVLVDEESYKSGVVRQAFRDYCDGDQDTLDRYLGHGPSQHSRPALAGPGHPGASAAYQRQCQQPASSPSTPWW